MSEFDQKRQEANHELIEILTAQVKARPSERFGQILRNCGFIKENMKFHETGNFYPDGWSNEFNTEPQEILKRVKETLKK